MHKITLPSSFPNLPSSIVKVQTMFNQKDVDFAKFVELFDEEPILCANILKLVNSPFYGMKNKITSMTQALTLLGVTIIRGIMMATLLKKSFPLDLSPYEMSIDEFDNLSVQRVRFINLWLKNSNYDIPYLASLTFLMECGKIVLSQAIIEDKASQEFLELKSKTNYMQAEEALFGSDSYHVVSTLFHEWMFEEKFTDILKNVSKPKSEEEAILHIVSRVISMDSMFDEDELEYAYRMIQERKLDLVSFKNSVTTIKKDL